MKNYITFIGHSTLLINMDNFKILTDPNLARFVFYMPRLSKMLYKVSDLREANLILISHHHNDHLNKSTLKKFPKKIPIVSHEGNKKYIKEHNFKNIFGLKYWESLEFMSGKIKLTLVPAKHGKIVRWKDDVDAGGFVIESGGKTIYFAGDTAFSRDIFEEIASKFKVDVLLMPIGAYYPRWILRDVHISPKEAVEALRIINAEKMIPIHWGSFIFAIETPNEPVRVLKKALKGSGFESRLLVLNEGETFFF